VKVPAHRLEQQTIAPEQKKKAWQTLERNKSMRVRTLATPSQKDPQIGVSSTQTVAESYPPLKPQFGQEWSSGNGVQWLQPDMRREAPRRMYLVRSSRQQTLLKTLKCELPYQNLLLIQVIFWSMLYKRNFMEWWIL
jgi:hypothetical protein